MSAPGWTVGIDLAPASMRHRAAGTARHVEEQARALFALDVPWKWVPVVDDRSNPVYAEAERWNPVVRPVKRISQYAMLELGAIWRQAGCHMAFCTAYFVPVGTLPVVVNYFDANFYEPVDTWHRRKDPLKHLFLRAAFRYALERSRTIFIASDYGRTKLAGVFPRLAKKITVNPCGIQPAVTSPAPAPMWSCALRKPFVLYVGSFSDNKNQRTLLRAWHALQTVNPNAPALVLLGPCPADYRRDVIEPLLRSLPRPEEVLITGFVPESDLVWAYQNAWAYVQPSFAEGFGIPILEAMSYGLPVACSNTTSLPETAGDAALLFDPHDSATIADSVNKLLHDEALRARLRLAGVARASNFRWEMNANRVASCILTHLRSLK